MCKKTPVFPYNAEFTIKFIGATGGTNSLHYRPSFRRGMVRPGGLTPCCMRRLGSLLMKMSF